MKTIRKYGETLRKINSRKNFFCLGQKFGEWEVIDAQPYANINIKGNVVWIRCKCKCGIEKLQRTQHLLSGNSKSCKKCRPVLNGSESKIWCGEGKLSATFFWRIKYEAETRNILFNVSIKYLSNLFNKQKEKCTLTGRILTFGIKSKNDYYEKTTASLDRIDSNKGYIEGNVQWVHKHINLAKRDFSQQYFIDLCEEVSEWKK